MRKIKITALLLAALMVLTAFVGCAKTDPAVDALDDRVTAIEGKLDGQSSALDKIDDSINSLAEALKKAQEAADAAAEAAKKAEEEAAKQEAADKAAAEQAAADAAKLALAVSEAAKKVELAEVAFEAEAEEGIYPAAVVAKVRAAFIDARAALSSAAIKSVADVNAILATLEAATAYKSAKVIVEEIYNSFIGNIASGKTEYYDGLTIKNIQDLIAVIKGEEDKDDLATAASKAAVDKLLPGITDDEVLLADGAKFVLANGNVLEDVYAAISTLIDAATKSYDGVKVIKYKAKATDASFNKKIELYSLAVVEEAAELLDEAIANIGTVSANAAKVTEIEELGEVYEEWTEAAKTLSAANVALVTKADVLAAALARVSVLADANEAYKKLGDRIANLGRASVFADYIELVADGNEDNYEKLSVYDDIDAKITAWANSFGLSAVEIADIVDRNETALTYKAYTENHTIALAWKAALDSFKPFVAGIKALNKIVAISQTDIDSKIALDKALNEWAETSVKFYDEDGELEREVKLADAAITTSSGARGMINYIVYKSGLSYFPAGKQTGAVETADYYDFGEPLVAAFFAEGGEYSDALEIAEYINDAVKAIDVKKATSVADLVAIKGEYELVDGIYVKAEAPAVTTIAGFKAEYKEDADDESDFAYDLSGLIDDAKYTEVYAAVTKRVDDLDALASNVATLFGKIDDKNNDEALKDADFGTAAYINLDDLATVNAAFDAYKAFLAKGNKNVAKWVANTDEDGKVIADEFKLVKIIDADLMDDQLVEYKNKVDALVEMAEAVVEAFELANKMNAYAAIKYDETLLAILAKEVKTEKVAGEEVKNTYFTYVKADLVVTDPAVKTAEEDIADALTQMQVIKEAYDLYAAFIAANAVEYFVEKDGEQVDNEKVETYAPVEAAIAANAFAKYVLAFNKGLAYDLIVAVDAGNKEVVKNLYVGYVADAADVAELETILENFDVEFGTELAVGFEALELPIEA